MSSHLAAQEPALALSLETNCHGCAFHFYGVVVLTVGLREGMERPKESLLGEVEMLRRS